MLLGFVQLLVVALTATLAASLSAGLRVYFSIASLTRSESHGVPLGYAQLLVVALTATLAGIL